MHWQFERYNYGFERFRKILARYPKVNFIGHAQTWWANIDKNHRRSIGAVPKRAGHAGGWTDRYLTDYPNMFGDLSAGSGLNALTRDEDFTRDFLSATATVSSSAAIAATSRDRVTRARGPRP